MAMTDPKPDPYAIAEREAIQSVEREEEEEAK